MLVSLSLSREHKESLQTQLVEQIRRMIVTGKLRPGATMPPSRLLAEQYDLSRNTVLQAYDRLRSEGYIFTEHGLKTRVSLEVPESNLFVQQKKPCDIADTSQPRRAPVVFRGKAPVLPPIRQPCKKLIDFWPGRSNSDHFPLSNLKSLADVCLSRRSGGLTDHWLDPAGLPALREAVARHIEAARGVSCSPNRIIITAGTQEALNIIARLLVTQGTPVVMENPGYGSAALVFESYGARLLPICVDREGIRVEDFPKSRASLAFVTPSHQFPTGAAMSEERRNRIVDWAIRTGAYIVEDDYDSDYNFSGPPLLSLAGRDRSGSVIYTGTLSKSLGSGVRTGFIVLPERLLGAALEVKALLNHGHPWLEQAILAEFIDSGAFARHLRKIRLAYSVALSTILEKIRLEFGEQDIWGTHNGMHIMWRLPAEFDDAQTIVNLIRQRNVEAYTLKSGGAYDVTSGYGPNSILLGYAALTTAQIESGVKSIASAVQAFRLGGGD